jgi:hypothetical protein
VDEIQNAVHELDEHASKVLSTHLTLLNTFTQSGKMMLLTLVRPASGSISLSKNFQMPHG